MSTIPQYLHTNSDIFSVFQQSVDLLHFYTDCIYPDCFRQHMVYTGARNGTIDRFDMRIAEHRSQKLFDNRFADVPRSPVLHLNVIRDSELLISHMNGDVSPCSRWIVLNHAVLNINIELVTFDLRFSSVTSPPSPVRRYENHVNSYTQNLVRPFMIQVRT